MRKVTFKRVEINPARTVDTEGYAYSIGDITAILWKGEDQRWRACELTTGLSIMSALRVDSGRSRANLKNWLGELKAPEWQSKLIRARKACARINPPENAG